MNKINIFMAMNFKFVDMSEKEDNYFSKRTMWLSRLKWSYLLLLFRRERAEFR